MGQNKLSVKSLFSQGIKDSSFYFISGVASKIVSIAAIPLVVRIVSVKEFAVYDMFLMVSGILLMISTLGMDSGGSIIIAENINNKKVLSRVIGLEMFSNILALLLFCLSGYIVFFSGVNMFFSISQLNYLFLYTLSFLVIYNTFNFLRWTGKAKEASFVNFLSTSVSTIVGFVVLYLSKSKNIDSFLLGISLGSFIGLFLCVYLLKEYLVSFKLSEIGKIRKELLKLSIPYIPTYIGNRLMRMIDRLIIITFLGPVALGYYALASRISNVPQQGLSVFSRGFRPIMFQNYMNEAGKKLVKKFYEWYMFFIPLELIIIIFLSKPITLLFGGAKYYDSIPLVPVLLLSTLYFSSLYFDGFGYSIKRKTHFIPIITGSAVVINAILSILLLKKFNTMGVALGTLLSSVFFSFTYVFFAERLYPFKYNFKKILCTTIITIFILIVRLFI